MVNDVSGKYRLCLQGWTPLFEKHHIAEEYNSSFTDLEASSLIYVNIKIRKRLRYKILK